MTIFLLVEVGLKLKTQSKILDCWPYESSDVMMYQIL
jgi:hypothetical protein